MTAGSCCFRPEEQPPLIVSGPAPLSAGEVFGQTGYSRVLERIADVRAPFPRLDYERLAYMAGGSCK